MIAGYYSKKNLLIIALFFTACVALRAFFGMPFGLAFLVVGLIFTMWIVTRLWPRHPWQTSIGVGVVLAGAIPYALNNIVRVPLATSLLIFGFIYLLWMMTVLWPRNKQTGYRHFGIAIPAIWLFMSVAFATIWWNQPYAGWSICLTHGLMHEGDFIEILRPNVVSAAQAMSIEQKIDAAILQKNDSGLRGAAANNAVDAFKQCVNSYGIEGCRYIGNGARLPAYFTKTSGVVIEKKLTFEIGIFPNDGGGADLYLQIPEYGVDVSHRKICSPGCDCNEQYGR